MWNTYKEAVLKTSREVANKGFVVGTSGNISTRISEPGEKELLAITPSGRYYDLLRLNDIVIVNFEGDLVQGNLSPTIETMLHIEIYKARKNVNAIIHFHPVFGSVAAITGLNIPPVLEDQVACLGGEIKVAEYALPGSMKLVQNVIYALGPRNAVILANHGALSTGQNMREAFTNCEMLEKTAKIYIHALGAGKINPLSDEALKMEQAFFNHTQSNNI